MKIVITVVLTLVGLALLGIIYMYSGIYDVGVHNRDKGITKWILETTMDNSVEHHAKDITAPALDDSAMIWKGFTHYDRMCGCHSDPDEKPRPSHFEPPPPPLYRAAKDWKPNQLFWIIKNGIKMSGMPAFGMRSSDDEIWAMVAFLKVFPQMPVDQFTAWQDKFRMERQLQMMQRQQLQKKQKDTD